MSLTNLKARRPELLLRELIRKSAQGQLREKSENVPFLFRALVIAVDVNGGVLENPSGSGTVTHVVDGKKVEIGASIGPANPKNSIKARVLDGFDQFAVGDEFRTFWPFFPEHLSPPIKPGEYVYVTFEDPNWEHGLWVSKVAGHENLNIFRGRDSFVQSQGLSRHFGEGSADTKDDDQTATESKPDKNLSTLFGE